MHHSYSMFSAVFNLIVIFAIFNLVMKVIKKSKAANQGENKPQAPKPQNVETVIKSTPPVANHPVKNLTFNHKPTAKAQLQLKRCPNCGGEIPLSMMKCDLCGTRQSGCGWISILIIIFVVLFVIYAIAKDAGFPLMWYLQQIFEFMF
jgi:RNA polymerase subunit RPABC4/transcription elongation factor Spt4